MLQELMISAFKKAMAVFVAFTTIVGSTTPSAFAGSSGDGCATPIQHIVVIFQENISFDHYFGNLSECHESRRANRVSCRCPARRP